MANDSGSAYEVLSPWAEADPIPLKGIAPRLSDLNGKTIGFVRNSKRAARPVFTVLEEKLSEKYPLIEFSTYVFLPNDEIEETKELAAYEEWLKGVDGVVFAFGD